MKEKNYSAAVTHFRAAAEQGDAEAQWELGNCYFEGLGVEQSFDKAAEWYGKAAAQGHSTAEGDLDACFENGYMTAEAKALLQAAEQGDAEAQYRLGERYLLGDGVAMNDEEAYKWFAQAAVQGHRQAQHDLAVHYELNDKVEALKWWRMAADQGSAEAQRHMGRYYDHGVGGVEQNDGEAEKWYTLAAEQGDAPAKQYLADLKKPRLLRRIKKTLNR